MKLSAYFPVSATLGASSLYDSPTPNWRRLSVACKHTVTGRVAGKDRAGSASVQYNSDFRPAVDLGEVVNLDSSVLIALQSRDVVKSHMDKLRPRLPYDVSATTPGFADFRALMAVISAAEAAGSARQRVIYSRGTAEYQVTPSGHREPRIGDLHIGPSVCRTSREFITFLKLVGQAGVKRVTILSDTSLTPEAVPLAGQGLAVFCAKIKAIVQQGANELCAYGSHELASVGGTTAAMSLNAHSDEGGWVRGMLTSMSYPPSTGILLGTGSSFNGVPLQECLHKEDIMTKVIADYLSSIALLHVADVTLNGSTSVYEREPGSRACLDSYGTLSADIDRVLEQWALLICRRDDMHPDATTDGSAFSACYDRRAIDRHFEDNLTIVPWWFVETAPLLLESYPGYDVCARHGTISKLPLLNVEEVTHDSPVLDDRGRVMHGATVGFVRRSGPFRMEGASYLFNERYSDGETLARFRINDRSIRKPSDAFMFAGDTGPDIESMRWKVPHNPLPHPLEGISDAAVEFQAMSVSYLEDPTPADLASGTVNSFFGLFSVVQKTEAAARVTYRGCPRTLRRKMKLESPHFQRLFRIKVNGEPSPPRPGPPPVQEHAPPLSDVESVDDNSELSEADDPGPPPPDVPTTEAVPRPPQDSDPAGENDFISSADSTVQIARSGDPMSRPTPPITTKAVKVTAAGKDGGASATPV
ncbi:coat protein [Diatom colony associated dsRNA virus 3]|uniref:coat protein n=1 Tax=Diatom colony associated dsRNA virus 3 TaxID=1678161 RepID=UPI0007A64FC5|nr:coat protein [Diatom colony associated dsRNA virus 3]BAU79485.1 coat protein [Diatom colony associated dsRNA virus 3]